MTKPLTDRERELRRSLSPWERELLAQLPIAIAKIRWPCQGARDRTRLLERVQVLGWAQKVGEQLELTPEGAKRARRSFEPTPATSSPPEEEAPAPPKKGRKKK